MLNNYVDQIFYITPNRKKNLTAIDAHQTVLIILQLVKLQLDNILYS